MQSATAVAVFSLMASAIYCFNDVLDAESDRAHPTKRTRPIAAGLVSPELGVAWGCVLAAAAIALSWFLLPVRRAGGARRLRHQQRRSTTRA